MLNDLVLASPPTDGVAVLTLNSPEKLNAISDALRACLGEALAHAVADDNARVIVLRGNGRAFSAGADLTPGAYATPDNAEDDRLHMLSIMESFLEFWDAPKPVIAQVHGYCLGVANILAACCDIVVAAETATFGWPKLPLGAGMIGPTWIWSVGVRRAKELSYQVGSETSGAEAFRLGFVNHAYPPERVEGETMALARNIAKTPADLLRIKKSAFNKAVDRMGFRETLIDSAAWDALAHTAPSIAATTGAVAEHGLKAAIAQFETE